MAERATELRELFKAISGGEKKSFNLLFLTYYERLKRFAFQYTKQEESAEEIVSEVFIKLWLRRTNLLKISEPHLYLYKSIKNASLNHLRKKGKCSFVVLCEANIDETHSPHERNPEKAMEAKELKVYLDRVVEALPEQRRLIFKMIKEDGLKCKEAAELLGLSVRTVENQVYKAVKTLAAKLEIYSNDYTDTSGKGPFLFLIICVSILTVFGVL